MGEVSIGKMYGLKAIKLGKEKYPIQVWYNALIKKKESELTVADVLHMFRQGICMSLALKKALDYLEQDIWSGELYDGELFEKLTTLEQINLKNNIYRIRRIIAIAKEEGVIHYWDSDEERNDFFNLVETLETKIKGD
ncbi:MAG: hypothetical protein II020_08735 [Lachnospiraceae bacterium]|nr:hypothetical protein [Lachnospiraceae bacterium]MBQ2466946.1 hypothetical protein [Lachnospiraceae bacterium]MBQ5386054.1 hypothetical protein [Lachnospiraceae bacterium]